MKKIIGKTASLSKRSVLGHHRYFIFPLVGTPYFHLTVVYLLHYVAFNPLKNNNNNNNNDNNRTITHSEISHADNQLYHGNEG